MSSFLSLLMLFLTPELQINWLSEARPVIELRLVGEDKLFDKCISKGQEVRYRFEFQLCERGAIIDDCSSEKVQTQFLSWSPISNSYSLVVDRHRDQQLPKGKQFTDREKARIAIRKIENLDILTTFGINQLKPDHYLHARAFSECRGEYNKTLADLSYYLTFGLIRLSGFNTGWYDYELNVR